MMRATKQVVQAAILGFGIPALLLAFAMVFLFPEKNQENILETVPTIQTKPSSSAAPVHTVEISVLHEGVLESMDLEEYIVGVVLAEMPASFEMEALKAQAVASRTYALKTCLDAEKHAGAVCTSYQCCQSYMSAEAYLQRGWSEKSVDRVRKAVYETAGQVLTYESQLIRATYFACSGGCTEDAIEVWGKVYPYLLSVKSPGEEETVYFTDTKEFTLSDFQEALGTQLSDSPQTWFGSFTYTEGGGVDVVHIGGVPYRGTTLRALLGLRSTVFEVIVTEDKIIFITKGYGHRVGMSQYGADAMALEGSSYRQILQYYYQGTEIVTYNQYNSEK